MKSYLLLPAAALVLAATTHAQTAQPAQPAKIWRCGNTYTNDPAEARTRPECKVVEGGNVTVVEGTRVNSSAGASTSTANTVRVATAPSSSRIDANEQRQRDSDARSILEAELKKAEAQRESMLKEWNNGEPEKMGPEHKNHQKYLDRVAELKANISRNESDIAGIRRELQRAGGTVPASK